jgi:hypothetical protein
MITGPGFAPEAKPGLFFTTTTITMDKKDFWPKKGKLKKGLIILAIVIVGATIITLVEEKIDVKLSKKVPFIIALSCIGVWLYNPDKSKTNPPVQP